MTTTRRNAGRFGLILGSSLLGVLTGCIRAQPPAPRVDAVVAVSVPEVEVRAESDFYEPLTPYGRWEIVGTYGRCWIPGRVEADWRPYCNGHWQRTEAGWYWASEEPWGWATYHYGRWDLSPQLGWYWVPQTQWAPAWVSWHEGGGYVGWAALPPSARFSGGGSVEVNRAVIAPRAYVFVEPRHFLEPVRVSSVAVNNTTIINKTVNITNIKVVNKTVINEGPRTTTIELASGQKVQPVAARELRRKEEAPLAARQRSAPGISGPQAPAPGRAVAPIVKKTPAEPAHEVRALEPKVRAEPSRNAGTVPPKVEPERRQKEAQNAAQEKSQKAALTRKNQLESEKRVRETEQKIQVQPAKKARELETKAPMHPAKEVKGPAKKDPKNAEKRTPAIKSEPTPAPKAVEPPPAKN